MWVGILGLPAAPFSYDLINVNPSLVRNSISSPEGIVTALGENGEFHVTDSLDIGERRRLAAPELG